jgi:hypothetical protein
MLTANNNVLMGNGSLKSVDQVRPGDEILDLNGTTRLVSGIIVQKTETDVTYRLINGKLTISRLHPLLGQDRNFLAAGNVRSEWAYRRVYVDQDLVMRSAYNWGVKPDDIKPLDIGSQILSHAGPVTIESIEEISVPKGTLIYYHKVEGPGMYEVSGFIVNAWPNYLWDYTAWCPYPEDTKVSIILLTQTGEVKILYNTDLDTLDYEFKIWNDLTQRFEDPQQVVTAQPLDGGMQIVA